MTRLRLHAIAAAVAGLSLCVEANSFAAAPVLPIEGSWLAASGGGVIELHRCGEALCGAITDSEDLRGNPDLRDLRDRRPELRSRRVKGLDILHGFRGGPDVWTDGRIYSPSDGRTYRASLRLTAPDTLRVTGCVVFPLCGSQTWTRAR